MMVVVNTKNLHAKRISLGISRYRLSVLSGLGSNAIFRMETKKQKVSYIRLQSVAKILKCDVSELIYKVDSNV